MVLGDAVSKLEMFVWIFKHISRFVAWSENIILSQMWWCQFVKRLKFETRPSFLLNFGMANWFQF